MWKSRQTIFLEGPAAWHEWLSVVTAEKYQPQQKNTYTKKLSSLEELMK